MDPSIAVAIVATVGVIIQTYRTWRSEDKKTNVDLSKVLDTRVQAELTRLDSMIQSHEVRIRQLETRERLLMLENNRLRRLLDDHHIEHDHIPEAPPLNSN